MSAEWQGLSVKALKKRGTLEEKAATNLEWTGLLLGCMGRYVVQCKVLRERERRTDSTQPANSFH